MIDLSVLIPARNEMFLARTIQDILEHAETNIEVIAVMDGQWAEPPVPLDKRVSIIYYPESIGQRAATNRAADISRGKYLMKVDAHCAFAQGFDRILIEDMQPDWTIVPVMKNLHAFDWVCPNGHRRYQGPSGVCKECGEPTTMDVVWIAKPSPNSTSYRFDKSLHFQYWGEYKKKQKGDLVETMSLQGSCWMMTREKYFELEPCDEKHGSWGQQGVEVACKTWLSGGKVIVDKKTWYAHMFRTQGGDFGFPYPNPGISKARQYSKDLWMNNKWNKAVHPLSWLIDKFNPPEWDVSKGIVYFTDNRLNPAIMKACQEQLMRAANGRRIVSVSLKKIDFGDNIALDLERGYLTMFKQILAGLEELDSDIVFLAEHDILYHSSHFDFVPPQKDKYYYNINVWKLRLADGHCLHYDCQQTSGLCAYRELLIQHYKERVRRVEAEGFSRNMGFEPGTHGRPQRVDDYKAESWRSEYPNVDIRHDKNLTSSRWNKEQFRNQRYTKGWLEADEILGWGKGINLVEKINGTIR
jgi:glycosyltransferase involved in cell wall biosynthesis